MEIYFMVYDDNLARCLTVNPCFIFWCRQQQTRNFQNYKFDRIQLISFAVSIFTTIKALQCLYWKGKGLGNSLFLTSPLQTS